VCRAGFQAVASYTFSHSIDSASTTICEYLNTPSSFGVRIYTGEIRKLDIRTAFTGRVTRRVPSLNRKEFVSNLGRLVADAFILGEIGTTGLAVVCMSFRRRASLRLRPNVNSGVPLNSMWRYPCGKIFNQASLRRDPAPAGNFGRMYSGFDASQATSGCSGNFASREGGLRFRADSSTS